MDVCFGAVLQATTATQRKWKINIDHVSSEYTLITLRYYSMISFWSDHLYIYIMCVQKHRTDLYSLFCTWFVVEPRGSWHFLQITHPWNNERTKSFLTSCNTELYIELSCVVNNTFISQSGGLVGTFPIHRRRRVSCCHLKGKPSLRCNSHVIPIIIYSSVFIREFELVSITREDSCN